MVLMRGHGATIVASSLHLCVYRAIYAALNAKLQMDALRLGGEINYLNENEVEYCMEGVESTNERAWALWKKEAAGKKRWDESRRVLSRRRPHPGMRRLRPSQHCLLHRALCRCRP